MSLNGTWPRSSAGAERAARWSHSSAQERAAAGWAQRAKKVISHTYESIDSDAALYDAHLDKLDAIDFETLTESEMLIWEVFFDHKVEGETKGRRIDPLILDLNRDGKFDITGANREGNGKIDGDTVSFDIDPSRQSRALNSLATDLGGEGGRSHLVDPLPGGKAVYNSGKTESTDKHGQGRWTEDPAKGQSAKVYNADQNWVGEWVAADWGYSHGGRLGRYYFSPIKTNEQTEWMKPGSGDGFLVWDKNGNGLIDDNTEMMSEFDVDGNKRFQNGFEKLAFYFDKDNNGVIEGEELGSQVWVDIDGDDRQRGAAAASQHGITEIVIPGHHELVSTTKTENWAADSTNTSAEKVSLRKATGVDNPLAGGHPTLEGLPTQQLLSTQESLYDRGSAGAKIRSQVRVGINIYEEKESFRDALDQIHLGVVEQLTRETFDEIIAGVVPLVNGQLDLDIGATQDRARPADRARMAQWWPILTRLESAIEGWRPEMSILRPWQGLWCLENANEQTSRTENVAPRHPITLNPDKPKAGDAVAASVTGSDPEGWRWGGTELERS